MCSGGGSSEPHTCRKAERDVIPPGPRLVVDVNLDCHLRANGEQAGIQALRLFWCPRPTAVVVEGWGGYPAMGRVETRKDPAILLPRGGRWQGGIFAFCISAYRLQAGVHDGQLGMGESPG